MGTIPRRTEASWTQLLSSELNSLASGAAVLQSTGTNAALDNTNGYEKADIELTVTFGSAPSAGGSVDIYMPSLSSDAVTYDDGSSSVQSQGNYIITIPVRAVTTKQVIALYDVDIPGEVINALLVNNSGVAFPASGSTLKIRRQGSQYT